MCWLSCRFATPMRTPRSTIAGQDSIMQQAANLAKLRDLQARCWGQRAPTLLAWTHPGIAPQKTVTATPNPLAAAAAAVGATPGPAGSQGATPQVGGLLGATPGRTGSGSIAGVPSTPGALAIAGVGATPLRGAGAAAGSFPRATPMRTPIRDQYGLNEGLGQLDAAGGSVRAQKAAAAALRAELRSGLAGLPAPENEYSVSMPELPVEDDGEGEQMEEDAADFKARKAREAEAARLAEGRKKTKVSTCIGECCR